jgi:hypothetical protein
MDSQDARAERIFQASRKATQYLGMNVVPVNEDTTVLPDDWTITKIEFWTTSSKGLWEVEYLEIKYTWGLLDPGESRKLVHRAEKGSPSSIKEMSADEMRSWLERPVVAYRRS